MSSSVGVPGSLYKNYVKLMNPEYQLLKRLKYVHQIEEYISSEELHEWYVQGGHDVAFEVTWKLLTDHHRVAMKKNRIIPASDMVAACAPLFKVLRQVPDVIRNGKYSVQILPLIQNLIGYTNSVEHRILGLDILLAYLDVLIEGSPAELAKAFGTSSSSNPSVISSKRLSMSLDASAGDSSARASSSSSSSPSSPSSHVSESIGMVSRLSGEWSLGSAMRAVSAGSGGSSTLTLQRLPIEDAVHLLVYASGVLNFLPDGRIPSRFTPCTLSSIYFQCSTPSCCSADFGRGDAHVLLSRFLDHITYSPNLSVRSFWWSFIQEYLIPILSFSHASRYGFGAVVSDCALEKFPESFVRSFSSWLAENMNDIELVDFYCADVFVFEWVLDVFRQNLSGELVSVPTMLQTCEMLRSWLRGDERTAYPRPRVLKRFLQQYCCEIISIFCAVFLPRTKSSQEENLYAELCGTVLDIFASFNTKCDEFDRDTWNFFMRSLMQLAEDLILLDSPNRRSRFWDDSISYLLKTLFDLFGRADLIKSASDSLWESFSSCLMRIRETSYVCNQWKSSILRYTGYLIDYHFYDKEDRELLPLGALRKEKAAFLWTKYFALPGDLSSLRNPSVFSSYMKGIEQIADLFLTIGRRGNIPGAAGSPVPKSVRPPEPNVLLDIFGPTLWSACLRLETECDEARSIALTVLCKILCYQGRERILSEHLEISYFSLIRNLLCGSRIVVHAILVNVSSLLSYNLENILCLLGPLLYAMESELTEFNVSAEIIQSCASICLSAVFLPLHFGSISVPEYRFESDLPFSGCESKSRPAFELHARLFPIFSRLLGSGTQSLEVLDNSLWGLTFLLIGNVIYSESPAPGLIHSSLETILENSVHVNDEVCSVSAQCLEFLCPYLPHLIGTDRKTFSIIVSRLCRNIMNENVSLRPNRETVVWRLYGVLSEILLSVPADVFRSSDERFFSLLFSAIESGLPLQPGYKGDKSDPPKLISDASEGLLLNLVTRFDIFPWLHGPEMVSSEYVEYDEDSSLTVSNDTPLLQLFPKGVGPPLFYVLHDSKIISVQDCFDETGPAVIFVMRDMTGRYAWKFRPLLSHPRLFPLHPSFSKYYSDPMSVDAVPDNDLSKDRPVRVRRTKDGRVLSLDRNSGAVFRHPYSKHPGVLSSEEKQFVSGFDTAFSSASNVSENRGISSSMDKFTSETLLDSASHTQQNKSPLKSGRVGSAAALAAAALQRSFSAPQRRSSFLGGSANSSGDRIISDVSTITSSTQSSSRRVNSSDDIPLDPTCISSSIGGIEAGYESADSADSADSEWVLDDLPSIVFDSNSSLSEADGDSWNPRILPTYSSSIDYKHVDILARLRQYIHLTHPDSESFSTRVLPTAEELAKDEVELERAIIERMTLEMESSQGKYLKCPPWRPSSHSESQVYYRLSRSFLSQFGFVSEKMLNQFIPLETNVKLVRSLKALDARLERETFKVGVLYVRRGQETEMELFTNESGSPLYEEFLSSLGWEVDLETHRGFCGGLDRSGSTGTSTVYWSSASLELIFHIATRMPTDHDSEDQKQIHKKRHLGNDHVTVIWSEHEYDYNPNTVKSKFDFVRLVLYPLPQDLCRVQLYIREGVASFGPLHNNMVVPLSILGNFVRSTVINANRVVRYAEKNFQKPYPTRRDTISEIVERHKMTVSPEEYFGRLFDPVDDAFRPPVVVSDS